MKKSRWTINEDIYLVYWIGGGIDDKSVARDIGRSEASVRERWNFLRSKKGELRSAVIAKIHKMRRRIAIDLSTIEDMGADVEGWLAGEYPTNDFAAAEMPDLFPQESIGDRA